MSTTKQPYQVVQPKEAPGLFSCLFTHEAISTKVKFDWVGPKISQPVWNEVLAFFKWTYDTTKSESQVRLFVNPKTKEWKAWAFPQKARTGMTAKELDTDETKVQRAQFKESEGWYYFGTVHHHCAASAFQSGTDQDNEASQNGIHITVGNMDADQYSIHERFYMSGYLLNDFDLSKLWDVEDVWKEMPKSVKKIMSAADAKAKLARFYMGVPPPADTAFPEVWKTNLVEDQPTHFQQKSWSGNGNGWTTQTELHGYINQKQLYTERSKHAYEFDMKRALSELKVFCKLDLEKVNNAPPSVFSLSEIIRELCSLSDTHLDVLEIIARNDTLPDDMVLFMDEAEAKELELELAQEMSGLNDHLPPSTGKRRHKAGNPQPAQNQHLNIDEEEYWFPGPMETPGGKLG